MKRVREAKLMFYKWLTPTGKLLRVTDTYTERIQGGGAFFWTVNKAEAEATALTQPAPCVLLTRAPHPLHLSSAHEEVGSRERRHPSN